MLSFPAPVLRRRRIRIGLRRILTAACQERINPSWQALQQVSISTKENVDLLKCPFSERFNLSENGSKNAKPLDVQPRHPPSHHDQHGRVSPGRLVRSRRTVEV